MSEITVKEGSALTMVVRDEIPDDIDKLEYSGERIKRGSPRTLLLWVNAVLHNVLVELSVSRLDAFQSPPMAKSPECTTDYARKRSDKFT